MDLVDDVLVAGLAGLLDRRRLQLLGLRLRVVHAVAGHATDVARLVLAALEVLVFAAVVAGQTDPARLTDGQRFRVLDLRLVSPAVHVSLTRPMAALASLSGRGRARILRASVRGP